jgi:hypothetical protein
MDVNANIYLILSTWAFSIVAVAIIVYRLERSESRVKAIWEFLTRRDDGTSFRKDQKQQANQEAPVGFGSNDPGTETTQAKKP